MTTKCLLPVPTHIRVSFPNDYFQCLCPQRSSSCLLLTARLFIISRWALIRLLSCYFLSSGSWNVHPLVVESILLSHVQIMLAFRCYWDSSSQGRNPRLGAQCEIQTPFSSERFTIVIILQYLGHLPRSVSQIHRISAPFSFVVVSLYF